MFTGKKGNSARAVVIGLDGTPFSFLEKELASGNLPNLADLFRSGTLSRMDSEIPTISSVAWASFMTGVSPGEHGIYGFTDRKPGTYELYFPNYAHLQAEPFWDRLSREGKRCCVINVPSTYPARELNGVLVSGFVAPNLERATYPREAYDYLQRSGYRIDVDAAKGRESLDLLLEDLHETLEKRREALLHFWNSESWDLFVGVFTGTDRLHHFLWRHYEDGDPVYAGEFMRYYRRVDEIIGEFVEMLDGDTALFMLSDHGFCPIRQEVYLNSSLREGGFLSLKGEKAVTIADIDPVATRVYCMDPGRLYVNLEGREPAGIVAGDSYLETLDEAIEYLGSLTDPESDETVIDSFHAPGDLYSGPLLDRAPDLVAMPRRGYDLKGAIGRPDTFSSAHLTGMHTHDDAFWFAGTEGGSQVTNIRMAASAILECLN